MKARRLIPIAAAFTCALFILAFQFLFTADVEHARAEGDRLSVFGLRSNEEIVVATLFAHRRAQGREYRIRREGDQLTTVIFDTTPSWSRGDGKGGATLLLMRGLSNAEAEGLDETIAFCREVREEISSATQHIQLRYFRDGKQIGEEFYLGFSLLSQLAWYDHQGMRGDPDYADDYNRLSTQHGMSLERLLRMVPFETLEKEGPNFDSSVSQQLTHDSG